MVIGEGGFGKIYKCRFKNHLDNQFYAVKDYSKLFRYNDKNQDKRIDNLKKEFTTTQKCCHPYVVQVYKFSYEESN